MLMISVDEVMDILEEYAVCSPDEEKSLIQRINQASMFIDGIGTAGKWISVKDRLPEKEGAYIVYKTNITHLFVAIWNGKEWNSFINRSTLKRITHWVSLPEPPKENSDGY